MKHIEGPLTYFVGNSNGRGLIRIEEEDTGEHIASAPRGTQSEANIAELVRRYNSHDAILAALKGLLRYAEINTCQHDETHRGGAIWTICDQCGRKWADDEGGFQPYVEPKEITEAHAAIAAAEPKAEGKG